MVELIWDGKYDSNGKRTAPPRLKLPFQTVETVNESARQRQLALDLFSSGRPAAWRNRLIWGDKKYVLPALLDEFAGQIDLIYIDPPFNVGADFSYQVEVEDERFTKEASIIEQKAYRDTWGKGLDSYLQWFYEVVVILHDLLTENGSIYVHLDYHVGHYAKAILDEVFGENCFQNEICWKRATSGSAKARAKRFGADHDVIYFYSKSDVANFNPVYMEYPEEEIKKRFRQSDTRGHYKDAELGTYSQETLERLQHEDRLIITKGGKFRYKIYLDEIKGVLVDSVWTDIPIVNSQAKERLDYPTQKPEALLERIINASSNENDLVLDCFCLRAGSLVRVVDAPLNPSTRNAPLNPPASRGTFEAPPASRKPFETPSVSKKSLKTPPVYGGLGGPTYHSIEQIHAGQIVLSHDGQPHRVLQTHRREYQGQIIGVQREGNSNILWLTKDHRILCQKRPIRFPRQPDARNGWSHVSPQMFARSQELRQNSTPAERKLWQALRRNQLGVTFRRQHPLGPYIADFYSRQAALVIELDGDSHTTAEGRAHDANRTGWIEEIGLRELRFWNNEVMSNLPGVLATIKTVIDEFVVEGYPQYEWRQAAELRVGDSVFHGDNLTPSPITAIQTQETAETVFDLTIEAGHSYLTDVCLVHNCGSGTTAAVAEKLNRRWITCDLGRFAIHTARKRLLSIENVKPFMVQNLGKYERQAWQAAEFGGPEQAANVVTHYRRFILELYNARPIEGYAWLHGLKRGRMVHVGAVDSPVSVSDVRQIAIEFHKATGTGADAPSESAVDLLGWDFAFELNEVAKQQAAEANISMRFVRIPREVLEKKAVEQGDIKFFELAALSVEVAQEGRAVNLKLTDFVIPPDDVPADVQAAITHWSQWIDYWAVDWDNQGDTFHNMWQTYRTRQDKSLGLRAGHNYDGPGEYTIMVKVIDILGNDTTKTLRVKVT